MIERDPSSAFRRLLLGEGEDLHRILGETRFGSALLKAASAAPPPSEAKPSLAPLPPTRAAIQAAISDTFTTDELGTEASDQAAILAHSATIMIGGRRRLRLTDEARADLLERVRDDEQYKKMLREAIEADQRDFDKITEDEVRTCSAWLRGFLVGEIGSLDQSPPRELHAAVQARECLRLVQNLPTNMPSLAEVRRYLERAELLEPLRILTGTTGGWDGFAVEDRFVGRREELRELRAFVDELASEGVLESVTRGIGRVVRGVESVFDGRGVGVFVIEAGGGLGKSTLMAKFVLDHALKQSRPFPFAYFDFDRATLQPLEPRQLLLEAIRQVVLQFPAAGPEADKLCQQIRDDLARTKSGTGLFDPFADFRRLVSDRVTHGRRAFLLILDTMELVQYDPSALAGVVKFVEYLSQGGFPELRVVAAGRADIPQLRNETAYLGEGTHRRLLPLSVGDAREMADRLGRQLLGQDWNSTWSSRIAGKDDDSVERREPLVIRVAVEFLRSAPTREEREALSREIEKLGAGADKRFVGRLYERRVLDHVQHPDAKKLAWPGLVVRRITLDIIRNVLAVPCKMDPSHTQEAFDALAREVWIVDREGDALRHRADLRARTLPLMRDHKPEVFAEIAAAAVVYFGERQATSPADRAEWIYHRLLNGEDPASVDRDWSDDLVSFLRGAEDDFERDSAARNYLVARTETRLLPPAQIAKLPNRLAFDHVARTAVQLGGFDDERIYPVLGDLALRSISADSNWGVLPTTVRAIVLVKTGRWGATEIPQDVAGAWLPHAVFARRFKRARALADTVPAREDDKASDISAVPGDDIRSMVQSLALACVRNHPTMRNIDRRLATLLERGFQAAGHADIAALRTAAVFGDECAVPAARYWVKQSVGRHLDREPAVSLAELSVLARAGSRIQKRAETEIGKELGRLRQKWDALLKLMNEKEPQPRRFVDRGLHRVVIELVGDLIEGGAESRVAMRRFFAARDEDWVVPMGYAAARAVRSGNVPSKVFERLEAFQVGPRKKYSNVDGYEPLMALRRADEAGDLAGVARAFANNATDRDGADDLRLLLDHYAAWRRQIESMIEKDARPQPKPPEPEPPRPRRTPRKRTTPRRKPR